MKTRGSETERKLRDALRRGDPVGEGRYPTPQELARMRRAVLDEAERAEIAPRLAGWRWAAITVCAAIVAVAGWRLLDRRVETTSPRVPTTEVARAADELVAQPDPSAPRVEAPDVRSEAKRILDVASSDPAEVSTGGEPDASTANLQARTLRLTAERGTQIIWTIDPELEL
jgi:anti-sigma-K factor RskA